MRIHQFDADDLEVPVFLLPGPSASQPRLAPAGILALEGPSTLHTLERDTATKDYYTNAAIFQISEIDDP